MPNPKMVTPIDVIDSINRHIRRKYVNAPFVNISRLSAITAETVRTIEKLTASKGKEYTAGSDDRLINFKRRAVESSVHPLQVWNVLFGKHLDSIRVWIKDTVTDDGEAEEKTYSEPITGRIDDAIVYLILLKAFYYESHQPEYNGEKAQQPVWPDEKSLKIKDNPQWTKQEIMDSAGVRRKDIFNAIISEREFQDKKYGTVLQTKHVPPFQYEQGPGGHELGSWIIILERELEEAKLAAIHGGSKKITGRDSIRAELVQVAAVAVAALEQHGLEETQ